MEFHDFISEIDFSSPYSDSNCELHKLTYSQNEMLSFIHENRFSVIYKRRQEGVSSAMCIYLLWLLINKPNYQVGMICSSRTERELFRQVINNNLHKIEKAFKKQNIDSAILTPTNHNMDFTKFSNGSKINYWTKNQPDAGRGYMLDFIYLSEISFMDNYMGIIQALSMCGGKFVLTTTELRNLKDDFFMNGDGISEYWCIGLYTARRFVMIEKIKLKSIDFEI
jgi:hypothetical protein